RSVQDVQQGFFLKQLPSSSRGGKYWYRVRGLDADAGTVVLFQYDDRIIASATLDRIESFDAPEGDYHGAFYFDVDSIRVFNAVGPERVRAIWPKVKRFSRAKWQLTLKGYAKFKRGLTGIKQPPPAPEAAKAQDLAAPPAARVRTTISRIVRNTRRANRVK